MERRAHKPQDTPAHTRANSTHVGPEQDVPIVGVYVSMQALVCCLGSIRPRVGVRHMCLLSCVIREAGNRLVVEVRSRPSELRVILAGVRRNTSM